MTSALLGILFVVTALVLVRNNTVHDVRVAFIDDKDLYPSKYEALPTYNQMLINPKFWHLWTKDAWVEWQKSSSNAG